MATDANKHGHAVYLEFHDNENNGQVAQLIIIGFGAVGNVVVPFRMLSRVISPANPQSSFRHDFDESNPFSAVKTFASSMLMRAARPETGIVLAKDTWAYHVGTIDAMSNGTWSLYKKPLIMQVSAMDYEDLKVRARPKKLIDRIGRMREIAGWSPLPSRVTATTSAVPF